MLFSSDFDCQEYIDSLIIFAEKNIPGFEIKRFKNHVTIWFDNNFFVRLTPDQYEDFRVGIAHPLVRNFFQIFENFAESNALVGTRDFLNWKNRGTLLDHKGLAIDFQQINHSEELFWTIIARELTRETIEKKSIAMAEVVARFIDIAMIKKISDWSSLIPVEFLGHFITIEQSPDPDIGNMLYIQFTKADDVIPITWEPNSIADVEKVLKELKIPEDIRKQIIEKIIKNPKPDIYIEDATQEEIDEVQHIIDDIKPGTTKAKIKNARNKVKSLIKEAEETYNSIAKTPYRETMIPEALTLPINKEEPESKPKPEPKDSYILQGQTDDGKWTNIHKSDSYEKIVEMMVKIGISGNSRYKDTRILKRNEVFSE